MKSFWGLSAAALGIARGDWGVEGIAGIVACGTYDIRFSVGSFWLGLLVGNFRLLTRKRRNTLVKLSQSSPSLCVCVRFSAQSHYCSQCCQFLRSKEAKMKNQGYNLFFYNKLRSYKITLRKLKNRTKTLANMKKKTKKSWMLITPHHSKIT